MFLVLGKVFSIKNINYLIQSMASILCAEDEGFEPSVGCPTHAFQACALGHYANPPVLLVGEGYRW